MSSSMEPSSRIGPSMSLTKRIVGLVGLALVPALAIQGYNEYALRTARGEAVRGEAIRAARSVAADLGQFGRGTRQVLDVLSEVPEIRDMEPASCTAYLKTLLGKVPGAFFFGVADADGGIVCNTLGSARGAYSLADRGYFRDAMRTGGFVIGEFVAGRITNKPTLQFAQAIPGTGGRPEGVVLASIDLTYLRASGPGRLPAECHAHRRGQERLHPDPIARPCGLGGQASPVRVLVGADGEPWQGHRPPGPSRKHAHHRHRGRDGGRSRFGYRRRRFLA